MGSLMVMVLAIGGVMIMLTGGVSSSVDTPNTQGNVTTTTDKQVIQIRVKGGYAPRNTVAKANIATVLNMTTNGTYDCSSALVIPSVGYRGNLPATGVTPIEIPPQAPGTVLKGLCSMGMYSFTVRFNE